MYVDPSRVEMALRYAALAVRSPDERTAKNVEVAIFIASLWADATNAARTRYTAAVERQPGSLPWSALTKPSLAAAAIKAGAPTLRGPAVVLLLLGQADPEDEGVEGYRLIAGEPRAAAIIQALFAWDVPLLSRTADPSGWRLDAAEEPEDQPAGAENDPEGTDVPSDVPSDVSSDVPTNVPDGEQPTTVSELSQRQQGLAVAGVAAAFAFVGIVAWRLG